ncbi:hypothetical protein [Human papillomavirus 123]|uniref:Uncharacterized protein E4 n=1 Tax=Human papillomavirus 123 TaxID=765055 RepID=D7P191_9PAPI|nr:hypothetical protein [Human papillomavirus 123]
MPFLLLLLPVLVGTPGTPRGRAPTPWLEKSRTRRETEKDLHPLKEDLERLRHRATGAPARRRLENEFDGDEDDEKENKTPDNNETPKPPEEQDPVSLLLKKWGEDVDWLKRRVSQDLDSFKWKLGIRP